MSLENLLKIGQLERQETNAVQVGRLLDTFRVKRNTNNYTGEDMDIASVEACIAACDALMQHVRVWLAKNHPELAQ